MPYMEAPPHPGRSPKFSGDDVGHEERLAAREAWDDARWKYTESIVVGRDKRLTDAECAAHEWQADAELERAARNLDDDYYNPHRFRLRAEYERRLDEWDTWVEFTLRPHALEES